MSARSGAGFLAAFVLVAGFLAWTASSEGFDRYSGPERRDYYSLLVEGFLQGQLSLAVTPDPALAAVADPYDPAQRPPGVGLHDASYYQGKYYIYFGVVPAVVLLLPFRIVTGMDLPLPAAVLVFALAGYAASLFLLAEVRRRHFPRVGPVAAALVGIAVGFVAGSAVLLRRGSMYDLPIASGYCWAMVALASWYRACHDPARGARWLAASSLAWGLAIGSRPIYLVAAGSLLLGVPLFWAAAGAGASGRRARWRLLFAAVGPIALVGAGLAAYNVARFGQVTEFGLRYILSGVYESRIEKFQLRYFPWNFQAQLLTWPDWGRYFPFFNAGVLPEPRPRQHFGIDHVFPVLILLPFLWLSALVPWAGRRWTAAGGRSWRVFLLSLGWVAAAQTGLILCFYAAMARYLVDYAPSLALLAAVGAFGALAWAAERGRAVRVAAGSAIAGVAGVSLVSLGVFSASLHGSLGKYHPSAHAALVRMANAPVHAWEAWSPPPFGPLRLEVSLPAGAGGGRSEELLRTGWSGRRDRILLVYPDTTHVRFVWEHEGAPPLAGPDLPLPRGRSVPVRIMLGSLFPPASHPWFQGPQGRERARFHRHARIEAGGLRALEGWRTAHPATPGTVVVGGEGSAAPFSGRWGTVAREPLDSLVPPARPAVPEGLQADARGTFRWRVRFPEAPAGRREPILVTGEAGRGDTFGVEYLGDGRIRFLLEHWGRASRFGPPVPVVAGREHLLELRHPLLAREGERDGVWTVVLDGRPVWRLQPRSYPVGPDELFLGVNPIGSSAVAERFGGTLAPAR